MWQILLIPFGLYIALAGRPLWAQSWQIEDMPVARARLSAARIGEDVYLIGGRNAAGETVGTVERFRTRDSSWDTSLPPLLTPRENAAAVATNDTIWVLGGRDSTRNVLAEVEFLAPGAASWQAFLPMSSAREGLEAVVLRGVIYAIGGFRKDGESDEFLDSVEFYDSRTGKWLLLGNWRLGTGVASFASAVVADSAFVMGGFSPLGPVNFVQRFETDLGALDRQTMIENRGGLSACSRHDSILVIGGRDASNRLRESVELFFINLNQWEYTYPLNIAREHFSAVTVAGTTYVFGGQNASGGIENSMEWITYRGLATGVQRDRKIPSGFRLHHNYPNPFNASSVITFELPAGLPTRVRLLIHNIHGELVRVLLDEDLEPGLYHTTWNGKNFEGKAVASGIYVYTIKALGRSLSEKMLLVR